MMKKLFTLLAALLLAAQVHAQTTTPNLGLTLPPAQENSWGDSYNQNFTIIDTAIGTGTGGVGGAPTDMDYLTRSSSGSLSAERVVTDGTTVSWDWSVAGQAKAGVVADSIGPTQVDETGAFAFSNTVFPVTVIGSLGAATTANTFKIVTDATGASCTVAGGSTRVLCLSDGTGWNPIGSGVEVDTLALVCARGCSFTGANSFATGLHIGESADVGWRIYSHPTNGPTISPVCGGVENDCDRITSAAAGKVIQFKNSSGTSKFLWTETTGALTDITLNAESSGNVITLPMEEWKEVAGCNNATASLIFNSPTANAPAAVCEGTNTRHATADFDDTTDEFFDEAWRLPTGFTGAIDWILRWKGAATSGAVGWCVQIIRVAQSAVSDPALPAQSAGNCVSSTADATTLEETEATITGVTCTSCVAGDRVNIRTSRDANGSAVTDSFIGDAKLIMRGKRWRIAH